MKQGFGLKGSRGVHPGSSFWLHCTLFLLIRSLTSHCTAAAAAAAFSSSAAAAAATLLLLFLLRQLLATVA